MNCPAVGIEGPDDRIDALLKELEGKDIADVVAGGLSKLASVPSGGGGVAAPAGGGGGGAGRGHPAHAYTPPSFSIIKCAVQ